ncbi:LmeA family phospholipid-binding protein [Streptomyces sp. NBC_00847]|uniref:LmeA family phospholipid-binding protein n=1 Tax=Streptomyces sp. NBC_00847 TaxID=2975850 RepID=UPI00224F548A|nr:LmeA family phospholipid-binding protein [Streptomyces sp. NBC_00847]MCX4881831.1 LmeA family phospholipid-binding protein [Streptomyces sp. NBC_00847]
MRAPHHISTHPYRNPYEELGDLDDGPLEEFLHEDVDEGAAARASGVPASGVPALGVRAWDLQATDVQTPVVAEEAQDGDAAWAPPNHRRSGRRRRRGRFAGLPLALKAVAGLVVLAAFLTLADRWALLYAERRAADSLKDRMRLSAAPEVEISGFPFVTQLADGRLESVKVTVPDVAADRVSLAKVTATAHDVLLDAPDGPTSVRGAAIPRLDGDVLLSFDDLNRELGASQVTFTGHGRDRVLARGTLPVAGHDLRLRADARISRDGDRSIATRIGGMRLDIGDLATYRPGTGASEGLHLTRGSAARLARETSKAKALFSVPSVVRRLGVPDSAVRAALRSDAELARVTGSPRFVHRAMRLNLIDLALEHPALLKRLGFDPALLDALPRLTRPVLADRLSLGFSLPTPHHGELRLRDVRVEKDGIRVRIQGSGLAVGRSR